MGEFGRTLELVSWACSDLWSRIGGDLLAIVVLVGSLTVPELSGGRVTVVVSLQGSHSIA